MSVSSRRIRISNNLARQGDSSLFSFPSCDRVVSSLYSDHRIHWLGENTRLLSAVFQESILPGYPVPALEPSSPVLAFCFGT